MLVFYVTLDWQSWKGDCCNAKHYTYHVLSWYFAFEQTRLVAWGWTHNQHSSASHMRLPGYENNNRYLRFLIAFCGCSESPWIYLNLYLTPKPTAIVTLSWYKLWLLSLGYNAGECEHRTVLQHFRCQHVIPTSAVTFSTFSIGTMFIASLSCCIRSTSETGRQILEDPHIVNISLISWNTGSQVTTWSTSFSVFRWLNTLTFSSLEKLFHLFGPSSMKNSSCSLVCLWNSCKSGAW